MNEVKKGAVPARLVYLYSRVPGNLLLQVVFEWDAPWPDKYVIECHSGRHIVARSSRLPWATVAEFLNSTRDQVQDDLGAWYQKVFSRLCAEGGANQKIS